MAAGDTAMTPVRRAFAGALLASVVGLAAHSLFAQQPERVRVIIGFRQAPSLDEQNLLAAAGGSVRHTYWLVPAVAAEVPITALQGLRNNPNVANVDVDTVVYEVDAELDNAWGVKRIGAGLVHDNGNKGAGVNVCVVDSGVAMGHPDLNANYLGGWDFVNGDSDPSDDRGHGTHVAGTILAEDDNSGVVGVAPAAKLLAYKILNASGQGYFSDAILALQYCLAAGGQVANHSYGSQGDPGATVRDAFDNAEALGLVNVASAGNRTSVGTTCTSIGFPARYASVIAVTATTSSDAIASFSCRGPEAELAAPGASIVSTVPTGTCAMCSSTGYLSANGTSMASPHVTGVAALVIAAGIAETTGIKGIADEVRLRLQTTADDLGTAGRDNNFGYGLVDADEAAAAGTAPTAPVEPTDLLASAASSSQIDLTWVDNSGNESGFRIERCQGAGCSSFTEIATVGPNVTTFPNTGLTAGTSYSYRVRSYNAGGNSPYSDTATAVTDAATATLSLNAVGYKVKGQRTADLTWSGSSATSIDVFRNGTKILTTPNDGAHTDTIGGRGGGTYTYIVCEAGTSVCSNSVGVAF
jgi:hypothetical protein